MRTTTSFTALTALLLFSVPSSAQILSRTVFTDSDHDISGIVTLHHSGDRSVFLTVHDSKLPWQDRLGLITIEGDSVIRYHSVEWPPDFPTLEDIESICRFPVDSTFVLMTSRGKGLRFRINEDSTGIEGIAEIRLPIHSKKHLQIEGIAFRQIHNRLYAFWGDRGKNHRPATVWWGPVDAGTLEIQMEDSVRITAPWPERKEVRHLSEMRFDSAGALWVTAARDGGNHGPFDSSLYLAGFFRLSDQQRLSFIPERPPVPLLRFPNHKVEGFDFVPGQPGGLVFATDDEKLGSILFTNW